SMVDQAEVYYAFLDRHGIPLNLGRTRRIATRGQTAALHARDGGCSFPGCSTAPEWTERHHVVPWIDGGPTDLNNLTLVCAYHHHNFATRGWTCRINPDGLPEWRPPKSVDSNQKPMINSRITALHAARLNRRQ
ncbi:MAG TPA: HNH endonuclease, partial [Propionibacteriaceae bacterium]|nr:HNH endonuclease [Propionibacteriaceae bacterium]